MAERKRGRISIFLDESLIQRIKRIALDQGTTSTKWITSQLTEILKQKRKA